MTSQDLFDVADRCVALGFFPQFVGKKFVLGLEVEGTGRTILHRKHLTFRLWCPCRVWLLSGRDRVLLGDSFAFPGDLECGVRPPWTG